MLLRILLLLSGLLMLASPAFAKVHIMTAENRPVIGRVEKVKLTDAGFFATARIDTGAGMTSIDAKVVRIKQSDDPEKPDRVVFRAKDGDGKLVKLERDIVEWQNIKRKDAKGYIRRPVVRLGFCIAGKKIRGRVNLADRSHFLYPILIGRNLLKTGDFLIDPGEKFIHSNACR